MKIVIDIPDNMQDMCQWHKDNICALTDIEVDILAEAVKNGTVLPKKYGKIVDLGKINKDYIIYLTVNGVYIEAVSLDYLNSLQAIIEEDKEE